MTVTKAISSTPMRFEAQIKQGRYWVTVDVFEIEQSRSEDTIQEEARAWMLKLLRRYRPTQPKMRIVGIS